MKHGEGSDPGAVVFDALSAAKARGTDIVIIDTAGRLHNKQNLMNELAKIRRIITRELPEADVETLMVIDATTGQNGLIQAKQFADTADITGIVLTKLDGTARGGIVFAIAREMGVPVKYVGVGEGMDDLMPFEPEVLFGGAAVMKLILASNNNGKVVEFREILAGTGIEVSRSVRPAADFEVDETGETFEENAFLKAEAAMKATGLPAVSDDSGLEVDALGGAPAYTARGIPEITTTPTWTGANSL